MLVIATIERGEFATPPFFILIFDYNLVMGFLFISFIIIIIVVGLLGKRKKIFK